MGCRESVKPDPKNSIKSNRWETAPQSLRQPRTKEQGHCGGIA